MIQNFLAVFVVGGVGSVLRYSVQLALKEHITATAFPWPTFVVNILGSFMIGLFYTLSDRLNLSPEVRLLLTTGLCGGFTTFSTFSHECHNLIRQGYTVMVVTYVVLSIVFGLCAAMGGVAAGKLH